MAHACMYCSIFHMGFSQSSSNSEFVLRDVGWLGSCQACWNLGISPAPSVSDLDSGLHLAGLRFEEKTFKATDKNDTIHKNEPSRWLSLEVNAESF